MQVSLIAYRHLICIYAFMHVTEWYSLIATSTSNVSLPSFFPTTNIPQHHITTLQHCNITTSSLIFTVGSGHELLSLQRIHV